MGLTELRQYQGQKFRNLLSLQFITSKIWVSVSFLELEIYHVVSKISKL